MLYEQRDYSLLPGRGPEFWGLYRERVYPVIARHSRLVGAWSPETGDLNVARFLWVFDDHEHRRACRAACAADPEWLPAAMSILPLITRQENSFMTDISLSTAPPS